MAVPSSGIVDLAIGLIFVFGVTAALASAVTEVVARFLGLRAAYLLTGLRELLDSGNVVTDLKTARNDYHNVREAMLGGATAGQPVAADVVAAKPVAAQGDAARADPAQAGTAVADTAVADHAVGDSAKPAGELSATGALLGGPILGSQGMAGLARTRNVTMEPRRPGSDVLVQKSSSPWSLWRNRRSLPSYISARSFADAIIDLLVPEASGETTMTSVRGAIDRLPTALGPLQRSLQALAKNAGDDITKFRAAVEHWYDDHMDRVSGWYKRSAAKITLVVGAILVVLLNINSLTIARTLYSDSTVNTAVSSVAARGKSCPADENQRACLSSLESVFSSAAAAGLPIGWGTVRDCLPATAHCNWLDQRGVFSRHGGSAWQLILVLLGFLIMVGAIVPGARFWFGLLSRLGTLRSSGPRPTAANSSSG
jgi:hypothetical protein